MTPTVLRNICSPFSIMKTNILTKRHWLPCHFQSRMYLLNSYWDCTMSLEADCLVLSCLCAIITLKIDILERELLVDIDWYCCLRGFHFQSARWSNLLCCRIPNNLLHSMKFMLKQRVDHQAWNPKSLELSTRTRIHCSSFSDRVQSQIELRVSTSNWSRLCIVWYENSNSSLSLVHVSPPPPPLPPPMSSA